MSSDVKLPSPELLELESGAHDDNPLPEFMPEELLHFAIPSLPPAELHHSVVPTAQPSAHVEGVAGRPVGPTSSEPT